MTHDEKITRMVGRFLAWKLPKDFRPDGGITFTPMFNEHTAHPMRHEPSGTNLFDANQAEAMIRHMLDGKDKEVAPPPTDNRQRVRHKKRGTTYRVIGKASLQTSAPLADGSAMIVYQSEQDGSCWVRPESEFDDGRFEPAEEQG